MHWCLVFMLLVTNVSQLQKMHTLSFVQRVRERTPLNGSPPPGRLPKPDVVLASYEAVSSDVPFLKDIRWEAVVVDVRHR